MTPVMPSEIVEVRFIAWVIGQTPGMVSHFCIDNMHGLTALHLL